MLKGVVTHLVDLRRGYVLGKKATHTSPFAMHFEHNLGGFLPAHAKKFLQNGDDKLHGGEIVVQQHHLEHRRRLNLGLLPFQHGGVVILFSHIKILSKLARDATKWPYYPTECVIRITGVRDKWVSATKNQETHLNFEPLSPIKAYLSLF